MSGIDGDTVGQVTEEVTEPTDERPVVAAREVGASDAHLENVVA